MPATLTNGRSGRLVDTSKSKARRTSKLHAVMLEAKRIREAHLNGELTAEEAAEKLADLYNKHRFKVYRSGRSLLSA